MDITELATTHREQLDTMAEKVRNSLRSKKISTSLANADEIENKYPNLKMEGYMVHTTTYRPFEGSTEFENFVYRALVNSEIWIHPLAFSSLVRAVDCRVKSGLAWAQAIHPELKEVRSIKKIIQDRYRARGISCPDEVTDLIVDFIDKLSPNVGDDKDLVDKVIPKVYGGFSC